MTTDFEDPALDELLNRHAATWRDGFELPALDRMLDQAATGPARHSRRWAWPIAAAAVLLAIPIATVAVARHQPHGSKPANPPASVTNHGPVTEGSVAPQAWDSAIIQTDGRTVSVQVTLKVACGQPMRAARASIVTATATTVSIRATSYVRSDATLAPPGPGQNCFNSQDIIQELYPSVTVTALNGRTLIDATTGAKHGLLDARTVPTPSYVPAGFTGGAVSWQETHDPNTPNDPNAYVRTYHNAIGEFRIERQTYDYYSILLPFPVSAGDVNGHPALYSKVPFGQVGWRDGKYFWLVTELAYNGTGKTVLDEASLLKIARSLH